jgi:hypothetical protein
MNARKKSTEKAQRVAKPSRGTLSPALAAENERFRICVTARRLLPSLSADVGKSIRSKEVSPYGQRRWYRDWQQQLVDAGFQFVQHLNIVFADYSAFTNPELGFDALLSEGDKPGCEIVTYHSDHTVTTVANFAALVGGEFAPPSRVWTHLKGASPTQLVEHLRELVRGKELQRIDASACVSRFTEVVNRVEHEIGERALHVLKTPTILIDGSPARYERVGCYFDFVRAGWKDPSYSSANWVRDWEREFVAPNSNPPDSTAAAVDAAMKLVAMSHFEFASAPDPKDFLGPGSAVALAHFRAIARAGKNEVHAAPWFQFRALLSGLLLCALAGRWETFNEVCNVVQPKLASANTAEEEDLDFAQVLLLLISNYRDRALPKAAALEQAVAKRLAKRPRLLLEVWRAIGAGRAADFDKALRRSLEHFTELRGDALVPAQRLPFKSWNDPFRYVALPESLFHLAALDRGLKLRHLPPGLADALITPESLAMR